MAQLWCTLFVQVTLPVPLRRTFSYRVPAPLLGAAQVGVRVLVPFRNQLRTALITERSEQAPEGGYRIRDLHDVLDARPFVPEAQLALVQWIARYYHAPIGEAVDLAMPNALAPERAQLVYRLTTPPTTAPSNGEPERERSDDSQRAAHRGSIEAQREQSEPNVLELRLAGEPATDAAPCLDPIAVRAALLHALTSSPLGVPARELLAQAKGATRADLDKLTHEGLCVIEDVSDAKIKVRTETMISRTTTEASGRLGDKQRAILEFVDAHGETAYSELKELYSIGRQNLRSLLARELIETREEEILRDPFANRSIEKRAADPTLTPQQAVAVEAINRAIDRRTMTVNLLHGVTGSGKTEVYLRAIRHARAAGLDALVLLPEISLTPQFVNAVRAALDDEVTVLHSQLTPGEKADGWRRILRGDVHVVIGARSALFAPLRSLGVIIVDEEHDASYKQNDGVRYHARDAATVLATHAKCTVVLGSATPSLETFQKAREGRYALLEMPDRVHDRPLPEIDFVDLRTHRSIDDGPLVISEPLEAAVRDTVRRGEQVILFLNRRGFAPSVTCACCGESLKCNLCDISMTYHRRGNVVRCHYCGASKQKPRVCPTCNADELMHDGIGTEQVEEVIADIFPEARVLRLDRDTARGTKLHGILDTFRAEDADILVGTQMVTKGHDFPSVTLVGVLNGDQSLRFPDFRGGERTFQLLTQVAGRAGRGDRTGRVIIQSWNPDHYVLQAVRHTDYEGMAIREMQLRATQNYPPFGFLVIFRFRGVDYGEVSAVSEELSRVLHRHLPAEVDIIGPVDAPIARIRDQHRRQLMLRARERGPLHQAVHDSIAWLEDTKARPVLARVRVSVDIDPSTML